MLTYSQNADLENIEIRLSGDLDIDSTEIVEETLLPLMEKYRIVNLDFSEVVFVDSSGMGLLMNVVRTLNEGGTKIHILNVREDVMEIFEMLQIPHILGSDVFI